MFEIFLQDDPRTRENLLRETTTARLEFLPFAGDFSPVPISCQPRLQPRNSCKMSIPAAQSSSSKTILYVTLHSQLRKNYSQPRKILIQATCSRAISRPRKIPSRSIQNFQSGVHALRFPPIPFRYIVLYDVQTSCLDANERFSMSCSKNGRGESKRVHM